MKEFFFSSWIRYIICVVYVALIVIIYNAVYKYWNPFGFCDGFFIAGFSLICIGGLSICSYFGAFDIFSYMFANRKKEENKTLYDYSENKKVRRKKTRFYSVPYFVIGFLSILVALIFLLVFNSGK